MSKQKLRPGQIIWWLRRQFAGARRQNAALQQEIEELNREIEQFNRKFSYATSRYMAQNRALKARLKKEIEALGLTADEIRVANTRTQQIRDLEESNRRLAKKLVEATAEQPANQRRQQAEWTRKYRALEERFKQEIRFKIELSAELGNERTRSAVLRAIVDSWRERALATDEAMRLVWQVETGVALKRPETAEVHRNGEGF